MRLLIFSTPLLLLAANWPQAGGPDGTWQVTGAEPPSKWSVARNENIAWRATPVEILNRLLGFHWGMIPFPPSATTPDPIAPSVVLLPRPYPPALPHSAA